MAEPRLLEVREGWAAVGEGWAVFAPSRQGAIEQFRFAEKRHAEIEGRPDPLEESSSR